MDPSPPVSLSFDGIRIDLAGHRLWHEGNERALEPKAFGVLALLAQAPGRVFTRDEILDAVWGHRHVTPGVLNRVVTLLRHALGEDAHAPRYLHTVHGVGYRFDATPDPATPGHDAPTPATRPIEADPVVGDVAVADTPRAGRPRRRRGDRRAGTRRALALGGAGLLLLALLAVVAWRAWPRAAAAATPATATATRSVAVLPLFDAGRDTGERFFSDGLSEHLINALSRSESLKVVGRMSSFRFRDHAGDTRAIGRALGVDYLVSGSVQRSGDAVRIRVELASTRDGRALWSEHYDRPYRDLFALQDEIAGAVATALRTRLLPAPASARQGDRPPGGALAAYHAYLRGMQSFYDQDFRAAAAHQADAVALDPRYAAAWAQLAVASALVGYAERGTTARDAFARARLASERSLALAPDSGIAHAARGNLLLGADFDWDGAVAELRTGARLAPDNGPIHGGLSRALAARGELREALAERRRFLAIEPLQPFNHLLLADLLLADGQPDLAEASARTAEALQPRPVPSYQRMSIAIVRNDLHGAREIARGQRAGWREMNLALAMQLDPRSAEATAALARILADGTWQATSPYLLAQAYALRGEPDPMLRWLKAAWTRRDPNLHHLLYDPLILRFRDDPRLAAFCARVGLPPPARSEALGIDQIRARLAAPR